MSREGETLFHPVNGSSEKTWVGFSWPAFFFGIFWMLVKGLYAQAVISILISVVTAGFGVPVLWIVYGFIGNGLHRKSLVKKGYLNERQYQKSSNFEAQEPRKQSSQKSESDVVEKLTALAKLKESGALTQDEFEAQKARLLGA